MAEHCLSAPNMRNWSHRLDQQHATPRRLFALLQNTRSRTLNRELARRQPLQMKTSIWVLYRPNDQTRKVTRGEFRRRLVSYERRAGYRSKREAPAT
jgi:hypothetical protein